MSDSVACFGLWRQGPYPRSVAGNARIPFADLSRCLLRFSKRRVGVPVSTNSGAKPFWRGDGKELFYIGAGSHEIMSADVTLGASSVTLGATHELFPVSAVELPFGPYDVSRDGKKFLISSQSSEEGNRPLSLVINWTADLKK